MSEHEQSKLERTEKSIDGFLDRISKRRQESIRKSMARPLKDEILRTVYLVVCVSIDMLAIPIVLYDVVGDLWLLATVLILIPLFYIEYKLHDRWFALEAPAEPAIPDEQPLE
jgi:hypothetical protein